MNILFRNPFTEWKNLTADPCVVIKRDIIQIGELFQNLNDAVATLRSGSSKLNRVISQSAKLDIEIRKMEEELRKARDKKKQDKLGKTLSSLKDKKSSLIRSNKGIESSFVDKAAESYVDFIESINILYRLNIQCLTLIHRTRRDVDSLISRVKSLKYNDAALLGKIKEFSIARLNESKLSLKRILGSLYKRSEFQRRETFNPEELTKEISLQSTNVKIKKIRRLVIEISAIEDYVCTVSRNLTPPALHELVGNQLARQIADIELLSHHIKILTSRFNSLLQRYPENKKLKKPFKKVLKRVEKQTRLLLNSIDVRQYSSKIATERQQQGKVLQFRKKEEQEGMKKAA